MVCVQATDAILYAITVITCLDTLVHFALTLLPTYEIEKQ